MGHGMINRSVLQVTALALGLVMLAACASTVPGTASPADVPGPPPTAAAPAPGGPAVDVIPPPPLSVGTQIEAIRMAAATSLVQALFPDRTEGCVPYGPFVDAGDLEALYFVAGTAAPVLDRYGFVAGWGQCQTDANGLATLALTMEMSDPAATSLAVEELAAAALDAGEQSVTLPNTGAVAELLPGADGTETVQAWLAVGRTISYVFHTAPAGQGVDGADRLTADQAALLATFVPTPQADIPNLPEDPDGLRDVTLDPPGQVDSLTGPYELESYIRLAIDPFLERDVLTANGFVGMYSKQSSDGGLSYAVNLYGFPTSAQTNVAYVAFAELESTAFGGTPISVPSIPDAPCFAFDAGTDGVQRFYQRCYVGFGSYLAGVDVSGVSALDDVAIMDGLLVAQRDLIDG